MNSTRFHNTTKQHRIHSIQYMVDKIVLLDALREIYRTSCSTVGSRNINCKSYYNEYLKNGNTSGLFSYAAKYGYVNILEWGIQTYSRTRFHCYVLSIAYENNVTNVMDWGIKHKIPLDPSIITMATCNNINYKLLNWGIRQSPKIYPRCICINTTSYKPSRIDQRNELKLKKKEYKILEWGVRQNPKIFPNMYTINSAFALFLEDILDWCADHGLYPSSIGITNACSYESIESFDWALKRNVTTPDGLQILPSHEDIREATRHNKNRILTWYNNQVGF